MREFHNGGNCQLREGPSSNGSGERTALTHHEHMSYTTPVFNKSRLKPWIWGTIGEDFDGAIGPARVYYF